MEYSIENLVRGIPSIGSYGGVAEELQRVLADPQSTLVEYAEVIEKDPDLTARLLRLGNSSFYGFPNRLETVTEAITLIGIQQMQDLLNASNIIEIFEGVSPQFVTMRSFWQHSLSCGVAARLIAVERRLPKPDKFFVAGLLHDIGRLVLLLRSPTAARQVFELCAQDRRSLLDAEREVLGFDHAAVCGELLRVWNYPSRLVQAVAYHHHPMSAGLFQLEASVVHVANWMVNGLGLGSSGERFVPPLRDTAWQRVGLAPGQLTTILQATEQQIEAVEQTFLGPRTPARAAA
jgi:HD-like signal output (HDOD) protein